MVRMYTFVPGEYYHIYSRGTEKRIIFIDESDYKRFVKLLFLCNGQKPVDSRKYKGLSFVESVDKVGKDKENLVYIGAYCLMPNHFHLLIRERDPAGVSIFMRKLLTAYSMYFNTKYGRKGRLFESSYQSMHADYDEYLKYLFAYIHLNPLKIVDPNWKEGVRDKKKAIEYLSQYRFSSFLDYADVKRDVEIILSKDQFPNYFPSRADFLAGMFDWITYAKDNPLHGDNSIEKVGLSI
ncbi:MAG: transposase [Candidatus Zambryskibacteria bacterium]|nr:transposase [Candidatus Zambryskibacteria bacterium]